MKKLFSAAIRIFNENTSGFPFLLWVFGGISVAIFIFVFRNYEYVQFGKLSYVLFFSAIWVIASEVAKKRKLLNRRIHFILDSVFYIGVYGVIIYLTNGFEGNLFFCFFLRRYPLLFSARLPKLLFFLSF